MSDLHCLTCSLLDGGVVVGGATAGADGDVVEPSGCQGGEDTFGAGLRDGHRVLCFLIVTQGNQVPVHFTCRGTPRHAEEVCPPMVTNGHLTDCSWD